MMLATHNSGTGEKSGNLVSSLFSIFSKCQNKTIKEQYDAGVRLFDIRVRKNKKGEWINILIDIMLRIVELHNSLK